MGLGKCALEFPAMTLVRFMWNHHLLITFAACPPWLTIEGGAQKYIDAVLRDAHRAEIYLSTPVVSIQNQKDGKVIVNLGGKA